MAYRGEVVIPVPIEQAWDLWTNAARFPQWQTAVTQVRDVTGPLSEPGTTYVLHVGPKLERTVRVLVADRPVRHVVEQLGLGVRDETSATFEPVEGGTLLRVVTYAHLNPLMRLAARFTDARDRREFQHELDRLAALPLRPRPPAEPGGVYVAEAGGIRRRLTVLAIEPGRVHVRLHPGHLVPRDPEDRVPVPPAPVGEDLFLFPIWASARTSMDAMASGLPFLRLDGGHGVAHLAFADEAWIDAAPRRVGDEPVTEEDQGAVAAWRRRRAPTVGVDADLSFAPLATLRLPDDIAAPWIVAKVLRAEFLRVHVQLFADHFAERPERVRPWELERWWKPLTDEELDEMGAGPLERLAPDGVARAREPFLAFWELTRENLADAKPRFAGVTTLEGSELADWRRWRGDPL